MLKRMLTGAALVALAAWSVVRVTRPPAPVIVSAPDTIFSAERAMGHVWAIAVRPHALGMPDHDRVRDYILGQLSALGLEPQVQRATGIGTRYREAGQVQNILARLPGRNKGGKAVLLMSHYDGVEAGPAAADDAAGAAALLETIRALRAQRAPLENDIIALFTDGEEAGLLGAAAFAREHPWAKDVAAVVNVEARGTTGRSFMFETGPGNLDVARVLRTADDVTSGSVFAAVYRVMPNDTDLSELAVLGQPALNFAFAGGVERYHTTHDDIAHLNKGSLQHEGAQMLAVARTFATEPLPRPKTADGVYFDFPFVGLVVYPQWVAIVLAAVALVLVVLVAYRERRGFAIGSAATLVAIILAGFLGRPIAGWLQLLQSRMPWGGLARWSPTTFVAIALFAVAIALASLALARRWASDRAVDAGVLVVWAVLAITVSVLAPSASYLLIWPVLFSAVVLALPVTPRWKSARMTLSWIAAAVSILLIVGFAYGLGPVMLGVFAEGAVASALLVALVTLLIAPRIREVAGNRSDLGAAAVATVGVIVAAIGLFNVKRSAEHPVHTALAFVQHGDSGKAWFGSYSGMPDMWSQSAIGLAEPTPDWVSRVRDSRSRLWGRSVERATLGAPNAVLVADTSAGGERRIVLRVTAPPGTTALSMRVSGAKVSSSSIDGREVDTTRYRQHSSNWTLQYWAVPDTGAMIGLSIPVGSSINVELAARRPGLPSVAGLKIPARPEYVVQAQTGDASYVYRRMRF